MKMDKRKLTLHNITIQLFIITSIISNNGCIYTHAVYTTKITKSQLHQLAKRINTVLSDNDPNLTVGMKVVSTRTLELLYEKNSNHLFTPASNMKLFTATAALYILGPYYRYNTSIYADSIISNSIIKGNLYLKGSGDPDFTDLHLREMVESLQLHGIKSIQGDIIVDNTEFDNIPFGPGWMWDDGASWYWAPADAMTLNDNCIQVFVSPNMEINKPPIVKIHPNIDFISINNNGRTNLSDSIENKLKVERRWQTRENIIDIEGEISQNSPGETYIISIENPAYYAGTVLSKLISEEGIHFSGTVRLDTVPKWATLLTSHRSKPLKESITNFLKVSDNLTGELLVKKIGAVTDSSTGSWENGLKAIKTFLQNKVGIDTTQMVMADGSGVSRYNLVSPSQIVQLLLWVNHHFQIYPEFSSALPIGGADGTLQNRFFMTDVKPLTRAKTGTLQGVSSLSGYVVTHDNEILAFSILMEGFTGETAPYRALQDEIVTILSQFSRF